MPLESSLYKLDVVYRAAISFAGKSISRMDSGDFKESDHPRAEDGKFSSGGGAGSKTSKSASLASAKMQDGKRVSADGSALPDHIQKLKLPPAWTDVKYNPDPEGALQAQGKDAKGRLQSVYSEKFVKTQAAAKFERIRSLQKQFAKIEMQNAEGMKSQAPRTRDAADCLNLIMKMGVRPGSDNDTGAEKKAYGATTLKGEHVVKEGNNVFLRFTGKKGVFLNLKVDDANLASNLLGRAEIAGSKGLLFKYVTDKSLLEYTHTMGDGSFKTKDFRTHLGTSSALKLVAGMPRPKDEKSRAKAIKEVAIAVSKKLGNTPTIALQSYIDPAVFDDWG